MSGITRGAVDTRGFDTEFTRWTVPNVETLSGNKTITSTDARVQLLNPGGAVQRIITLDSSLHVVGTKVTICNTDSLDATFNYGSLYVKNSAAAALHSQALVYGGSESWVYTGTGATGWVRVSGVPGGQSYGGTVTLGAQALYVQNVTVTGNQFGIGSSPSSLFHVTAAGDANALRVDNTTGHIGIGAAPQASKLFVNKDVNDNTAIIGLQNQNAGAAVQAGLFVYTNANGGGGPTFGLYTGSVAFNGGATYLYNYAGALVLSASAGTSKGVILHTNGVGIGDYSSSLFHVTASGNANALRVDNTTGNIGVGNASYSGNKITISISGKSNAIVVDDTAPSQGILAFVHSSGVSVLGIDGNADAYLELQVHGGGNFVKFSLTSSYLNPSASGFCIGKAATGAAGMLLDIDTTTNKYALGLPSLTTTERDALTGINRMLIYNSTTDKVQAYAAGAWVDLH